MVPVAVSKTAWINAEIASSSIWITVVIASMFTWMHVEIVLKIGSINVPHGQQRTVMSNVQIAWSGKVIALMSGWTGAVIGSTIILIARVIVLIIAWIAVVNNVISGMIGVSTVLAVN